MMKTYRVTWGFREHTSPSLMISSYKSNYEIQSKLFSTEEKAKELVEKLNEAAKILNVPFNYYSNIHFGRFNNSIMILAEGIIP